jgi:flagellar biosynthesis protein FlhA
MLSLGTVLKVMQNLLREGIPIKDVRTIAESLAEQAGKSQDPGMLTAHVRESLSRSIVQKINGLATELPLIALDPALEQILQQSVQGAESGGFGLEPGLAERLQKSIADVTQQQEVSGEPAILVTTPEIRPWLSRWLRSVVKGLHVLSYNEIPDNKQVRVVATVGNLEPQTA